ncbi:hypothetical protein [Streptomyces sp. SAI-090]|uniref:hypothetical protein n=1 Tax=Streptomyces sp. SAI-090 TaxID=2940545 RepID=UPI0024745AAE|nr:hypothetical protein [Streptomyces sp. SAI-090]MDH6522301.1 hypothetical protein [Streptomyces sp. SAI-090]
MSFFALVLVTVQLLTTGAGAACLVRCHRHHPDQLTCSVHLVAPALLAASVFPLVALLAYRASPALWGLWAVGYNAAALVYIGADTARDVPRGRAARPAGS